MSNTVIIPTAGLGSRMGNYTRHLNKALLPYKDKPIIGHIIEQFPIDTRFIVPVGYLADQVTDFCRIAYADRQIEFVAIDDWTSPASGTGVTLAKCKDLINGPFWYVSCDTYFDQDILGEVGGRDCFFVKPVPENESSLYTMFKVSEHGIIEDITFKQQQACSPWMAFSGLMYIHNWQEFFSDLNQQTGNEFIPVIKRGSTVARLDSWLDFGSAEQYCTALAKSQKFDFSKSEEVTYICNGKVVKWWLDPTVAEKKYSKTLINPDIFPDGRCHINNFMAYDFCPGQTLYKYNNPDMFDQCLIWLKDSVWKPTRCDININSACDDFYRSKSLARIKKFLDKYPVLPDIRYVNGVKVKNYDHYLNKIDWDYLSRINAPGFIHGDLQFDNLIITPQGEFKAIDWRHEFAGLITLGDIYYDLAKMMGGLIVNYSDIKQHLFDIEVHNDSVTLNIPNVDHMHVYIKKLEEFIVKEGYDYQKVKTLVPIIFWNMSPLHTAPFDMFLWYLGIMLFEELEK